MRRLLAGLAATAAVATSLLISSAGPATAADATVTPAAAAPLATTQGAQSTADGRTPPELAIPEAGFKIVATLRGVGVQIYECKTDGSNDYGAAREPAAVLSPSRGGPVGIHGAIPGVGPFWENFDGSKVIGTLPPAASSPSPDPSKNIPRLLVKAQSPTVGTGGTFSKVGYIQRLDTRGGVAPTACNGKQTVAVDYSANYVFWAK